MSLLSVHPPCEQSSSIWCMYIAWQKFVAILPMFLTKHNTNFLGFGFVRYDIFLTMSFIFMHRILSELLLLSCFLFLFRASLPSVIVVDFLLLLFNRYSVINSWTNCWYLLHILCRICANVKTKTKGVHHCKPAYIISTWSSYHKYLSWIITLVLYQREASNPLPMTR